ncbi:MAG: hypothetical protein AUJ57_04100 [Zetaproteobacteria bacterium CG1_02_53_45]|nr:MAG: hypothetical protein AUJ57_04100 [Zetaproteobacteria bacterium CG1_02_53_45]
MNLRLGLRGKLALALAMMMLFALLASGYVGYLQAQTIVMEEEQNKLSVLSQHIESSLNVYRSNLLSLRDVPPIQAIARAKANAGIDPESGDSLKEWQQRLNIIFKAFLRNHPQYYQIRYIGADGDEWVRVERDRGGMIRAVAEGELQNKSEYPYVFETMNLQAGQIYHSAVNLNREHGEIQKPFQPVFRIATPAVDVRERKLGCVVINLFAEQLFASIHSEDNGIRRHIADEQGHFIKHSDPSKAFAFELGGDYAVQNAESDLFELARHKARYIRLHNHHSEMDGFQKIYYAPHDHNRYWLLLLHIPDHVVVGRIAAMLEQMLQITLVMGLVSLLLIYWFLSRRVVTPIARLADATRALQAGDASIRMDVATAYDEFKILYAALNGYAEQQQLSTEKLQSDVAKQSQNLAAVIDHIVDGIITISADGSIESFNPAARNIFGYEDHEVIGQNVKVLMPDPYHSKHDGYLNHYLTTGEKKIIGIGREVAGQRKDGSTFPMELAVSEVFIEQSRHFVGIVRDISERKQAEEKIRKMAHFDQLTNLPNRALFNDRIDHSLTLAKRHTEQLALLFIDLDGFKTINDTLGHEAGDQLLQEVAKRLQACAREADTVARLGGDEFAVILVDINGAENAAQKAALIIQSVCQPYTDIDQACLIGCSIGIALYPDDAEDHKQLLSRADAAMYAVKYDGKNHYRFYHQGVANAAG